MTTPNEHITDTIPTLSLAYLGDSVMETLVRRRLVLSGAKPGELNRSALSFVTAVSQSAAAGRLLPCLTEEEGEVFRRGRNARGKNVPKNASLGDYMRATGLETLFGYLTLRGQDSRVRELFELAFPLEGQDAGNDNKDSGNRD